jgi:hypothetical protein
MFLLGATLALGFAAAAGRIADAMVNMRQENLIKVKGYAKQEVTSDWGTWRGSLCVRAKDLKDGYGTLEQHGSLIRNFLARFGFTDKELEYSPTSIDIEYKLNDKNVRTSEIESYVLRQIVGVASTDVLKIARVAKESSELIKQGIEFRSEAPSFFNTEIEKIKMDLLTKATENGLERAKIVAAQSNGKVGALSSASQGVTQITAPDSTECSGVGETDTTSIEKVIKVIVTLEFHVDK